MTCRAALSVEARGSSFVWIAMPWLRAVGGRNERNNRADLDLAEKGLNLVFTSVMKRVIMFAGGGRVLAGLRLCAGDEALQPRRGPETRRLWGFRKSVERGYGQFAVMAAAAGGGGPSGALWLTCCRKIRGGQQEG